MEKTAIRLLHPDGRVEALDLEDYLRAVVPQEMPAAWPVEALKAQAVAARCYALSEMAAGKHKAQGADLCTEVHCQAYRPQKVDPRTDAAIQATAGVTLRSRSGQLVHAFFSAACGGQTRNNEDVPGWPNRPVSYLRSVPCPCNRSRHGHGVGLCQWGAKTLAEQGKTFEQILAHFYTGIQLEGQARPMTMTERLIELLRARFGDKFYDVRGDMPRHPTLQPEYLNFDAITGIAVHHTADEGTFKKAANYHVYGVDPQRNKGEWPTIAYAVGVGWGGRVCLLRDVEIAGYHVWGRNHELLSVSVAGNLMARAPSPEEQAAVQGVCEVYAALLGRDLEVRGHNDWALPGRGTSCPGPALSEWTRAYRVAAVAPVAPSPALKERATAARWWIEEALRAAQGGDVVRTQQILEQQIPALYAIEGAL